MNSHKEKAIDLRKQGYSYSYIQEKLNLSKSTLSYWLRDIVYSPNQYTKDKIGKARSRASEVKSNLKRKSIDEAGVLARKDIVDFNKRDLFMLGLGLYMGDGSKTQNMVRIVNSNPDIIRLAVKWFKDVCGLDESNFRLAIHLHFDNNKASSEKYWNKVTGIPISNFGKMQVDKRVSSHKKKNLLPHGTAHLSIVSNGKKEFGVFLFRRIEAWMDEIYKRV